MATYYEVKISAENRVQADAIMDSLLDKKLVPGGQFIAAPARFMWKGKAVDLHYVTITTYSTDKHRAALMADVRRTSVEEFPMITFVILSHINTELRQWIDETLA